MHSPNISSFPRASSPYSTPSNTHICPYSLDPTGLTCLKEVAASKSCPSALPRPGMPRVEDQGESFLCCPRGGGTSSYLSSMSPRAKGKKQTGINSPLKTFRSHSRALPDGPQQCSPVYHKRLPSALQGDPTTSLPLEEASLGCTHPYLLTSRGLPPNKPPGP